MKYIYFLLIIMKYAFFPITGMLLTLDNIYPSSFLCVHYLSLSAFWFFLTTLSRIYVLLLCFVFACLLACFFLTGTDTGFAGIALACFPILLSLLFLLYCFSAFPFFFLIILPFLINFICHFFPSLHIFSSGDPIFFPQNNQPLPFIFVYLSFS